MRYIRAKLVWTDDPVDSPYLFDLLIDSNDRVLGKWPIYGVLCDESGKSTYPFILNNEGRIDFGPEYEAGERYENTNLRDRAIRKGEYVTFWDCYDEEWTFRVQDIHKMAEIALR